MSLIDTLKTELQTDPLTRGYVGMNDQQAADDLNTPYRDGTADPLALLEYLTLERFRSGNIYGRISMVARHGPQWNGTAWEIPPLPLGVGDADQTITQEHIAAANAMIRFVQTDTSTVVNLLDARFGNILNSLAGAGAGCFGPTDKTNIQALSQNRISRATELFGRGISTGEVNEARR